jgi:predicted deacetylase
MTNPTTARRLVVSIHDVAPATLAECRALRALVEDALGPVPVSLLVVPRYHGTATWTAAARSWLRWRADRGDEIVLHGLEHRGPGGADGAEFGRALTPAAAALRLREARDALARQDLDAEGVIAPAYLQPPAFDAACAAAGLRWWATRTALHSPGRTVRLPSVALRASTAARRALSPAAARLAARALAPADAVRLDLHPADLRHVRLAASLRPLLLTLWRQHRTPARHADLLRPVPVA